MLTYLDTQLDNLVTGSDEIPADRQLPARRPACVIHVRSARPRRVSGATCWSPSSRREATRLFLQERRSHARRRQRLSHRQAASAGGPRPPRGARERPVRRRGAEKGGRRKQQQDALSAYCVNLNNKAKAGKIDPLIGRKLRDQPHHPGVVPPFQEEQPALCRRSRRRQDGDRRGPGQAHRRGRIPACWQTPRSSRSTWARCLPARATAATSRSG